MKKRGIINIQLAGFIAGLGHKDTFVIGDAGLPIPKDIPIVDLALCGGVPSFVQVLKAVLEEVEVEYYCLAEEITTYNQGIYEVIQSSLQEVSFEMVPHVQFKEATKNVKFAIRTGEFTPYPNIILRAGVAFPV